MRALITGGRGFVGTWLARHLRDQGDEVVAVDQETDVADLEALSPVVAEAAPDAIYHLAALTHVGASWEHPEAVLRVNVLGTAAVLAAARAGPNRPTVLVVSSSEVYGAVRPEELPVTEDQPVAPVTPYAASKSAAEQVALQAWRGFGQPVIVVRPFNHVGPGQADTFAVSALARRIVTARRTGSTSLTVGSLTPRRDFTDVRDVVRAYRLVIERGEPGGSTTCARAATWRWPTSPIDCWPWPSATSSWWPIRPSCGRSTCPCCGAIPTGCTGSPAGSRPSPSTRPWPTSWPTGRPRTGPAVPDRASGRSGGRRGDPRPDLLAHDPDLLVGPDGGVRAGGGSCSSSGAREASTMPTSCSTSSSTIWARRASSDHVRSMSTVDARSATC